MINVICIMLNKKKYFTEKSNTKRINEKLNPIAKYKQMSRCAGYDATTPCVKNCQTYALPTHLSNWCSDFISGNRDERFGSFVDGIIPCFSRQTHTT